MTARHDLAATLRRGAILLGTWLVVLPVMIGSVVYGVHEVWAATQFAGYVYGSVFALAGVAIGTGLGLMGIKWASRQ